MIQPVAIIPVYNEEAILASCIEHLLNNGIGNIIVIDNESTDESVKIAKNSGAKVISFSSNGEFCEETITRNIKQNIEKLDQHFNWILKVDADEFLYSSIVNENLFQLIERNERNGFNCIGSYSHQVYPMRNEVVLLEKCFDPVRILNHVIPHTINDKYSKSEHLYFRCIWKINIFHRSLSYKNPHYVEGAINLSNELLLLKHIPYTIPSITKGRLINDRKRRLSKRNFEIGLSTHYNALPDNTNFLFDHIRDFCFNWDSLYNSYLNDFDKTVTNVIIMQKKLSLSDIFITC